MSRTRDTDYLTVSTRIRAMENRLLTRERLERMIEARDAAEARKLLAECGYADGVELEQALAQAREDTFRDLEGAVPDPGLLQVFQVKYDYHNAKVLLKARAVGADPERLLLAGGDTPPESCWRAGAGESSGSAPPPFSGPWRRAGRRWRRAMTPNRRT